MAGKKIILCFDGTCKDPNDAKQKKNIKLELKDASISNIFKLHLLLGGGVSKGEEHIKGQKAFTIQGWGLTATNCCSGLMPGWHCPTWMWDEL